MTSFFDLIGAVELTASAAIAVAVVSIAFGPDARVRLRLAVALGVWFAAVVLLAATGALGPEHGIGAPGMGLAVIVPIAALSASLWFVPALRAGLKTASLPLLIGMHAVRILGFSFLILAARGRLPAPFAPAAGWGDIFVGVTALPVAWMVARRTAHWRTALLAWNAIGLLDLAVAVTLGVLSSPGPLRQIFAEPGSAIMSTLPWLLIPGFVVPLLATTHLAIFHRVKNAARDRAQLATAAPSMQRQSIA
jgi:hypothetical protein